MEGRRRDHRKGDGGQPRANPEPRDQAPAHRPLESLRVGPEGGHGRGQTCAAETGPARSLDEVMLPGVESLGAVAEGPARPPAPRPSGGCTPGISCGKAAGRCPSLRTRGKQPALQGLGRF